MQSGADPDTDPQQLTNKQILMLHQLLHAAKFSDPTGTHLSPAGDFFLACLHMGMLGVYWSRCATLQVQVLAKVGAECQIHATILHWMQFMCCMTAGEYNLRLGITKELHPDLVATYQGKILDSASSACFEVNGISLDLLIQKPLLC